MVDKETPEMRIFQGDNLTWMRPATLQQLLDLKIKHPQAKMVVGNTEVGKWRNSRGCLCGQKLRCWLLDERILVMYVKLASPFTACMSFWRYMAHTSLKIMWRPSCAQDRIWGETSLKFWKLLKWWKELAELTGIHWCCRALLRGHWQRLSGQLM